MSSKAMTGAAALLKINTTGSTYISVAQIQSYTPTAPKWTFSEVTNAASPAVGGGVLKEQIPTVLDPGSWDFTGVWLYSDPGQVQLATDFFAGNQINFKLILALGEGQTVAGTEIDFAAYIESLPLPDIAYDKALTFKTTLQVNTQPTITYGS